MGDQLEVRTTRGGAERGEQRTSTGKSEEGEGRMSEALAGSVEALLPS
jgi:hypothetical protein